MKWTKENRTRYMKEYHRTGKTLKIQQKDEESEKLINCEHLKTIFGVEHEDVMV